MDRELPHPGTATEMYLAAILDELGAIRGRLPEQTPTVPDAETPGTVELTEPAPPKAARPQGRPRQKRG